MAECNCTEPSLNYTVDELNKILADGLINCSIRYLNPCCDNNLLKLTLSDAIVLVPEKERTPGRLITFLNKSDKPELWIFGGKSAVNWLDIDSWISIPTSSTYDDIYSRLTLLEKGLSDESTNRVNADNALQSQINSIIDNPNISVEALNQALNKEIQDRINGDRSLRIYLTQLIQDTSTTFQGKLDEEKADRVKEDDRLESYIKKLNPPGDNQVFISSFTIRGIEVVTEIPLVEDNIMYCQYEPLPDKATYNFYVEFESVPVNNKPINGNVTLYTILIGKEGVNRVRVLFGTTNKPDDSQVTGYAYDSTGTKYDFIDQGYWGPPNGFNIPVEYNETTPFVMNFSKPGKYSLYFKLIEIDTGKPISEKIMDVDVS